MWGEIASAGIGSLGSLMGGMMNATNSKKVAEMNLAAQKEFAQNGIRWKVADAKAAGLHPLAALGAQTTSFQPSFVGDTSMGDAMSSIGQNIGRAVQAGMSAKEREAAEFEQLAQTLQRNNLMNEKLQAEIDMINAQTASIYGQPNVSKGIPGANGSDLVPNTHQLMRTPDGKIVRGLSDSGNRRIENWTLDNPAGIIDMFEHGFYPWIVDYLKSNTDIIRNAYPLSKRFFNYMSGW